MRYKTLIYEPKADITVFELAEILKLVLYLLRPDKTVDGMTAEYDALSTASQRHFIIKDITI